MSGKSRTILIVDNDEATVAALKTRIESLGHRCLTAFSGAQAVCEFAADDVDLVITDLQMPAGNGISLMQRIRKASDVPIVVITGHRDDFKRCLRDIPNVSILRKPFATDDLITVLRAELAAHEEAA